MLTGGQMLRADRTELAARSALLLGGAGALAALGAFGAMLLYRQPPSATMLAGGVAMLALLSLAVARYDTAATLGFLLLGVVFVDPAPPDAVFAIVIAVALVTGRFDPTRAPLIIGALIGGFLTVNVMSTLEAVDPRTAAKFFAITLYLAVFGIWIAGYVNSERRARGVVRAYLAIAVASALIGPLALFAPIPLADRLTAAGFRAQGLFQDPNVYGPFLIPPALIVLEELMRPRLLRARAATKVTLFLALSIGILFSYSRAAWAAFLLGILVMLAVHAMRRGGSRRAVQVLAMLAVSAIAGLGVLGVTGSFGFLQERAKVQAYDTDRFGAQRTGLELVERYPFGIGPGQFEVRYPVATHSLYVRSISEQGALGLLAVLGIVIATLVFALSNAVAGRDTFGIGSAALLGAWCAIAMNSLFVDTLHWRHLWLIAGLIWATAASRRTQLSGVLSARTGSISGGRSAR